jgi:hypothetical protein
MYKINETNGTFKRHIRIDVLQQTPSTVLLMTLFYLCFPCFRSANTNQAERIVLNGLSITI